MDAGDGPGATLVVAVGDADMVVVHLVGLRPDLGSVDTLARLHLAARRLGYWIHLRDPCAELCDLLDLVGLADLGAGPGLLPEAGREAEGGEPLGVEKVVPPRDPSI